MRISLRYMVDVSSYVIDNRRRAVSVCIRNYIVGRIYLDVYIVLCACMRGYIDTRNADLWAHSIIVG